MSQIFLFYWILQTTRYLSFLFTVSYLTKWLMHMYMHTFLLSSTNGVHVYILLVVLVFCLGCPSYLITQKDPVHTHVLSSVYKMLSLQDFTIYLPQIMLCCHCLFDFLSLESDPIEDSTSLMPTSSLYLWPHFPHFHE